MEQIDWGTFFEEHPKVAEFWHIDDPFHFPLTATKLKQLTGVY